MLNPSAPPSNKPFQSSSRGWGEPIRQSHVTIAANGSPWWWCVLDVYACRKSICGGFGSRQNQIDRIGGEIAEARMAKDVKVVKNIKMSVRSFRDIRANGHLLR
jgi:hypothetical protein